MIPNLKFGSGVKNIILIIDESIRADHLSINGYSKATTPYLNSLMRDGFLANAGIALSGATCSPLSNAMLITGIKNASFKSSHVSQKPTIFQYAKKAGYRTIYIDAQTDVLWNGLNYSDLRFIDRWVKSSELGLPIYRDINAALLVRKMLREDEKQFIVMNKRGVHFMYENSYPPEEAHWKPLPNHTSYASDSKLVGNSYDNGIRFAVNKFFKVLIKRPFQLLKQSVFVYTSDHGQTLFENGEAWLHCNHTLSEAQVPLFLIGNPKPPIVREVKFSHQNIFASLLDLMGAESRRLPVYAQSVFRKDFIPEARCSLSGALKLICEKKGALEAGRFR